MQCHGPLYSPAAAATAGCPTRETRGRGARAGKGIELVTIMQNLRMRSVKPQAQKGSISYHIHEEREGFRVHRAPHFRSKNPGSIKDIRSGFAPAHLEFFSDLKRNSRSRLIPEAVRVIGGSHVTRDMGIE